MIHVIDHFVCSKGQRGGLYSQHGLLQVCLTIGKGEWPFLVKSGLSVCVVPSLRQMI